MILQHPKSCQKKQSVILLLFSVAKTYKGKLRLQLRTCPKISIQQLLISTLIGHLITHVWVSFESLCFLLLKYPVSSPLSPMLTIGCSCYSFQHVCMLPSLYNYNKSSSTVLCCILLYWPIPNICATQAFQYYLVKIPT